MTRFAALDDRVLPEKIVRSPRGVKLGGVKKGEEAKAKPPRGNPTLTPEARGLLKRPPDRKEGWGTKSLGQEGGEGGQEARCSLGQAAPSSSPRLPHQPPLPRPGEPAQKAAPPGKGREAQGSLPAAASGKPKAGRVKLRTPRTAAVVLTAPSEGCTLAEAMAKVQGKIALEDLGIAVLKPRRAITGALILEVPGVDGASRADRLAACMLADEVLAAKGVRVAGPVKRAEIRITGLIDSATPGTVAAVVARVAGCLEGEVGMGEIHRSPSGLGSAWVQYPIAAAKKVADEGKLQVGWVQARVEALAPRLLQCYRCLEQGHIRQRCTAKIDHGDRCYRCGVAGHRAAGRSAVPRYPLCADIGRRAGQHQTSPLDNEGFGDGGRGDSLATTPSADTG